MLSIPLREDFRYIHEPLPITDTAIPVLGHEDLAERIGERLRYSRGGAFLVTGFRGVGKSTLVHRSLARAASEWDGPERLLVVRLNVARSMTTDQLLFAVVRRIFEALDDQGLLARLPRETRSSLLLAYTRTSLSFKQTRSESTDHGFSMGLASGLPHLVPTPSLSRTKSRSRATEAAFLAYSETDVEHDLIRIIQLLAGSEGTTPRAAASRSLVRRRHDGARQLRVHPVVVLDEIDKMTDGRSEALIKLEILLGQLKNVLASRGAHFLIIDGPDLHDQAVRDSDRGSGIYESVFGWSIYVPCIWDAPTRLLSGTRANHPAPGAMAAEDEQVLGYLAYKARGIPRRLLQEFNALVAWHDGRPELRVPEGDWPRIEFYHALQTITANAVTAMYSKSLAALPIDEDRARLTSYYVVDWTLRSRGRPFTAVDITEANDADPMLRMSATAVDRLLRHLKNSGVLDVIRESGQLDATRFGREAEGAFTSYALASTYRDKLADFARSSASERKDLGITALPSAHTYTSISVPPTAAAMGRPSSLGILADRFELLELIGQGGMGTVYRARNLMTGEVVAVKMLLRSFEEDREFRSRLRREAEIGAKIIHPGVARTLELVEATDGQLALILELIEGPTLRKAIDDHSPLPAGLVARICREITQVLAAADAVGIARLDLKPSNIMLPPDRGTVLVDLGIARADYARNETALTRAGGFVGTPGYMAPEQFSGVRTGIASDVFALGIVLYECLHGTPPWSGGTSMAEIIYQVLNTEVSVDDLPASEPLRALIKSMLNKDPAARPVPSQLLTDLELTPEASAELSLQDHLAARTALTDYTTTIIANPSHETL